MHNNSIDTRQFLGHFQKRLNFCSGIAFPTNKYSAPNPTYRAGSLLFMNSAAMSQSHAARRHEIVTVNCPSLLLASPHCVSARHLPANRNQNATNVSLLMYTCTQNVGGRGRLYTAAARTNCATLYVQFMLHRVHAVRIVSHRLSRCSDISRMRARECVYLIVLMRASTGHKTAALCAVSHGRRNYIRLYARVGRDAPDSGGHSGDSSTAGRRVWRMW